MTIPSFDEILEQARRISKQKAEDESPRTGELAAKGLSDFASRLFLTGYGTGKTYAGSLTREGEFRRFDKPYHTGGSLIERLIQGRQKTPIVPSGSFLLSPEESTEFGIKSALQQLKPKVSREQSLRTQFPSATSEDLENIFGLKGITPDTTFNQLLGLKSTSKQPLSTRGAIESGMDREFVKSIAPEVGESGDISNKELELRIRQGNVKTGRNEREDRLVLNYSEEMEKNFILREIRRQDIGLNAADSLVSLARTGNTVSANAVGMKIARGLGEVGVLTETDVTKYVESGRLDRKAADILSRWMQGKPTEATLSEIQQMASAIKDSYRNKVQPIYNNYVNRLARTLDITPKNAAFRLDVPYDPSIESAGKETAEPTKTEKVIKSGKTRSGVGYQLIEE